MKFVLKPWVAGPTANSRIVANAKSWIDLTRDSDIKGDGSIHGLALASQDDPPDDSCIVLGEGTTLKDVRLTPRVKSAIEGALGITLESGLESLDQAALDIVNLAADPTGQNTILPATLEELEQERSR